MMEGSKALLVWPWAQLALDGRMALWGCPLRARPRAVLRPRWRCPRVLRLRGGGVRPLSCVVVASILPCSDTRRPLASVLQSLARSSDSLGVCATRGTSSISDSLLGIEAADVALLVVRVLAAAIPSEDYWRFSDVSRGVRAAPRRAPTSEGLRQGPQPHTSRCVRPRTAGRGRDSAIRLPALRGVCGRPGGPRELRRASCPRD